MDRRISLLTAELKELHEQANEISVRNSILESKNKDLYHSSERVGAEDSETVARLKRENDRLGNENNTLTSRTTQLLNELDTLRAKLDDQCVNLGNTRNQTEQEIAELERRITDGQNQEVKLDEEYKRACRAKYEFECASKDESMTMNKQLDDLR